MGNVLRIFRRDVLRLLRAPAALVVVVALIILPSLYAWFNIIGFWNPYDNSGNMRVCVVNEDAGTSTDLMGKMNLGDQIVTELKSNTQLGWAFTDRQTAMDEVRSGKAYAVFVIPRDFSKNLASLLTGDFKQPKLEYFVNEKAGAVSPKITDTGATTLDETINSTFVSTVSSIIADAIDEAVTEYQGKTDASQAEVSLHINEAITAITDARTSISGLSESTTTALGSTDDAMSALQGAKADIDTLDSQLREVSKLAASLQTDMGVFTSQLMGVLDQSSIMASQAAAKMNASIGTAAGEVRGASGSIDAAISTGKAAAEQNDKIIQQLGDLQEDMPDGDAKVLLGQVIANLTSQNTQLKQSLADMEITNTDTASAATAIAAASNEANTAIQKTLTSTDEYRSTLSSVTLPALYNSLAQISSTADSLAGTVSNQKLLIDQATLVLEQLTETLQTTTTALDQTDELLANLASDLGTVQTDLAALGTSSALSDLIGDSLDANKIASFMLSPTELRTEAMYSLNAYGSAMAPLFTNLTLWIGVFMLMVILKQEVDDEGIKNLTIAQRYWGRWLFLAPIAALQAVVCCTGNLIIGVQAVNIPAFYLTAIIASLTYLSIQFALSTTLQHVGKGICIFLVFVQIPGATGLYPVEMTPDFFQALYPFFPFTYGINALRETIAGFYDGQWLFLMSILLVFFAIAFIVGLLVRPSLTNLNHLFSKQIEESDILNGEEIHGPQRRFRLGQLMRALSDREEYRERIHDHTVRFIRWYPRLKHGAWIFGIMVPAVVTVALSLAESEKLIVLTTWLTWLVLIMMFLIVIEHVRDSLNRQVSLGELSDDELRELFSVRNQIDPASEPDVSDNKSVIKKVKGQHEKERGQNDKEKSQHDKEKSQHDKEKSQHDKEKGQHEKERGQHEKERGQHDKERGQNDKERGKHKKEKGNHKIEKNRDEKKKGRDA